MKLLMATCSDESQMSFGQFTLPILKMYAKKWGADFKILGDQSYNELGEAMWNYRTLIFYDLFEIYDRILYLDSDIIINNNCPNVFDVVPYDTAGLVMEDKGSRLKARRKLIADIKSAYGDIEHWTTGYPNTGLYLTSKIHRDIFTKINGKLWDRLGYDGCHFMYQIMKFGYKWVDLGYKWNHMSMFSEPWNGSPSRFNSHILHYAGKGNFPDKGDRSRVQLMKDDVEKVYHGHLG